jgi:hypothetical protein
LVTYDEAEKRRRKQDTEAEGTMSHRKWKKLTTTVAQLTARRSRRFAQALSYNAHAKTQQKKTGFEAVTPRALGARLQKKSSPS